jgi:hypothetical protein
MSYLELVRAFESYYFRESGLSSKSKSYLPENKQYLITRNIPCLKRVKQMEYKDSECDLDDGWVSTHSDNGKGITEGTNFDIIMSRNTRDRRIVHRRKNSRDR